MAFGQRVELDYAPVAGANPLKGLVPYSDAASKAFPHSMEFNYLALTDLVKGEDHYDWAALESLLGKVAEGGRQTVFRIYMEFPGRASAIPGYLLDSGLEVRKSPDQKTDGEVTPDYEDPRLRRMLQNFISAMGKRYDGDARIGAITAGLLGCWATGASGTRTPTVIGPRVLEPKARCWMPTRTLSGKPRSSSVIRTMEALPVTLPMSGAASAFMTIHSHGARWIPATRTNPGSSCRR